MAKFELGQSVYIRARGGDVLNGIITQRIINESEFSVYIQYDVYVNLVCTARFSEADLLKLNPIPNRR